jgi:hypothetical protein
MVSELTSYADGTRPYSEFVASIKREDIAKASLIAGIEATDVVSAAAATYN